MKTYKEINDRINDHMQKRVMAVKNHTATGLKTYKQSVKEADAVLEALLWVLETE